MAFGDPTVNAFHFVLDGADGTKYDAFWDVFPLADFHDSQVRYKRADSPNDKWTYLTTQNNEGDTDTEVDYSKLNTPEDVDAEYRRLMAIHNESIKKAFGDGSSTIPEKGMERLHYLIKNETNEQDNILTPKA